MSKQKLKTKRGITLIALVITIVVMLILVAATVTVALNGGVFKSAKKATADTEAARAKESELSSGRVKINGTWYDSMEDYMAGKKSSDQAMPTYDKAQTNEDGILKENAKWTDETGTAVIPAGFKVINGIENNQKVENGLVIQDASGNEFVWIPVTFTKEDDEQPNEDGLYQSFLDVFYRSNWSDFGRGSNKYTDTSGSSYNEPFDNGYDNEKSDYNEMMRSVQENGGFYIGRYEAGSVDKETKTIGQPRIENTANGTTGVVIKKDQIPYVWVSWGLAMNDIDSDIDYKGNDLGKGAVYLSKHFYDGKEVGVVSTLCYSIQWDAMLEFLNKGETNKFNLKDSTSWGNYKSNIWTIENANASYYSNNTWTAFSSEENKKTNTSNGLLLTTGASNDFAAKNIYDIAGNCLEWTMETRSSDKRTLRGGYFTYDGSSYPANSRGSNGPGECSYAVSFRPALYIKN